MPIHHPQSLACWGPCCQDAENSHEACHDECAPAKIHQILQLSSSYFELSLLSCFLQGHPLRREPPCLHAGHASRLCRTCPCFSRRRECPEQSAGNRLTAATARWVRECKPQTGSPCPAAPRRRSVQPQSACLQLAIRYSQPQVPSKAHVYSELEGYCWTGHNCSQSSFASTGIHSQKKSLGQVHAYVMVRPA